MGLLLGIAANKSVDSLLIVQHILLTHIYINCNADCRVRWIKVLDTLLTLSSERQMSYNVDV